LVTVQHRGRGYRCPRACRIASGTSDGARMPTKLCQKGDSATETWHTCARQVFM